MPATGSWIEHGPTTTNRRWSLRSRMLRSASRPCITVRAAFSESGSLACTVLGRGHRVKGSDVDVVEIERSHGLMVFCFQCPEHRGPVGRQGWKFALAVPLGGRLRRVAFSAASRAAGRATGLRKTA